jgi:hypothetical protein
VKTVYFRAMVFDLWRPLQFDSIAVIARGNQQSLLEARFNDDRFSASSIARRAPCFPIRAFQSHSAF